MQNDQLALQIAQEDAVSPIVPVVLFGAIGMVMGGGKGAVLGAVLGYVGANALSVARVVSDPRIAV